MTTIKEHPNEKINPSFNELLTMYCNDRLEWNPTKSEKTFLHSCYKINTIGKEYVTRLDFPTFSQESFRNYACRLSFCLKKVVNSRPPLYLLDGISIGNVTIKDTQLGKIKQDFENELLRLKTQPPFIHDIKLKTQTDGLYTNLLNTNHIPNKSNNGISIPNLPLNSKIESNVTVYPTGTLLVHLACTYHPIQYSNQGWLEVASLASKIELFLASIGKNEFTCKPVPDWYVTYYHFNKDGVIIDSPIHHYSIARLSEHSQIYIKKLQNGNTVLRYEEKLTPKNKTISDLQNESISEENYSASFEKASKIYQKKFRH